MQMGDVSRGRFASGDVAMIVDGPWQLINLKNSVKFKIGLAPLPVGPAGSITVSAGSGFGIATTSAHPGRGVEGGPDPHRRRCRTVPRLARPRLRLADRLPEILV